MMYKRILLKLSGEALGEKGWLFDHEKILAGWHSQGNQDGGTQVGVVIGAANPWRGRHGLSSGMDAVRADMMACWHRMNCVMMQDARRSTAVRQRCSPPCTCRMGDKYRAIWRMRRLSDGVAFSAAGWAILLPQIPPVLRAVDWGRCAVAGQEH